MITTFLIDIVNAIFGFIVQVLWPQSIAGIDLNTVNTGITNILLQAKPAFQMINIIIPINVLFSGIIVLFTVYFIFFGIKVGRMLIGILRGGG